MHWELVALVTKISIVYRGSSIQDSSYYTSLIPRETMASTTSYCISSMSIEQVWVKYLWLFCVYLASLLVIYANSVSSDLKEVLLPLNLYYIIA